MVKYDYKSVMIGVVGPDSIPVPAMTSILLITRRESDAAPQFVMAAKGYEARQMLVNNFMASKHDGLLLLDHDMIFPADTLERLRSHGRSMVSGYYMRRRYAPIAPVWFKPWAGQWPIEPWTAEPERGKLHPLGGSGWGCMLLHRAAIEDTRSILKGEWEVIEDDMDVWPYDVAAVVKGEEEIRPLRVDKNPVGSDIRYPFYALHAGHQLYGDPDVRAAHLLQYPLSPDDYTAHQGSAMVNDLQANVPAVVEVEKAERDEQYTRLGVTA